MTVRRHVGSASDLPVFGAQSHANSDMLTALWNLWPKKERSFAETCACVAVTAASRDATARFRANKCRLKWAAEIFSTSFYWSRPNETSSGLAEDPKVKDNRFPLPDDVKVDIHFRKYLCSFEKRKKRIVGLSDGKWRRLDWIKDSESARGDLINWFRIIH